jgi:hypothetical protein
MTVRRIPLDRVTRHALHYIHRNTHWRENMTNELAASINRLIAARDAGDASVQSEIDRLFSEFEASTTFKEDEASCLAMTRSMYRGD